MIDVGLPGIHDKQFGFFNCLSVKMSPHGYFLHAHENHEFFFCLQGTGKQLSDIQTYDMKCGDLFFYGAGTPHVCKPSEEMEERLKDVLHFLSHHFSEPLTVEEIAKMACLSRSHFHAIFKKSTGLTLMQYLNKLRISAAAQFLTKTDRAISSIAYDCGFSCISHFYSIFKAELKMSPREFRIHKELNLTQ